MPSATQELRQPMVKISRPTRGAAAPPRPLPMLTTDIARPRRRRNQLFTAAMDALL